MNSWPTNATTAARQLGCNAAFCGLVSLVPLVFASISATYRSLASPLGLLLVLFSCLVVLAFSIHLLFDTLLFRLASSYETETAGLAAIDDALLRMRIRRPDPNPRGLRQRISGSRRIVWQQRCALAICLVVFAILLIDANNGQPLC
ncbi:hypothetical protein FVA81_03000 (plasmid) [Rhizobium sp. WL3]|uniref:hypothetical protein n=1 Tax=Rhizobium sp. WL3 TaxID=2603277 RepID=UPI0011C1E5D4|nr:hypothetical protein [Rhizobium sp. WL3]QEE43610.1 hypothetical protein FVA81_03000 [Rhizobium sp. WL3]